MSRIAPVAFHKYAGEAIGVDWSDGRRTALPSRWLRGKCPCAHCVDEWTGERRVGEANVPADIHPLTLRSVGRYAVAITWSDKHESGIYSYQYLRELSDKFAQGPDLGPDGAKRCGAEHVHD